MLHPQGYGVFFFKWNPSLLHTFAHSLKSQTAVNSEQEIVYIDGW